MWCPSASPLAHVRTTASRPATTVRPTSGRATERTWQAPCLVTVPTATAPSKAQRRKPGCISKPSRRRRPSQEPQTATSLASQTTCTTCLSRPTTTVLVCTPTHGAQRSTVSTPRPLHKPTPAHRFSGTWRFCSLPGTKARTATATVKWIWTACPHRAPQRTSSRSARQRTIVPRSPPRGGDGGLVITRPTPSRTTAMRTTSTAWRRFPVGALPTTHASNRTSLHRARGS